MTENTISWGNISVSRHSKTMLSDLMEENKQLKERIRELEKENETLKDTIDGLTDTLAHTIDITPCGDVE